MIGWLTDNAQSTLLDLGAESWHVYSLKSIGERRGTLFLLNSHGNWKNGKHLFMWMTSLAEASNLYKAFD